MPLKRLRVADSNYVSRPSVVDWTKCCLCHKSNDEDLICPATHTAESLVGAGYRTLADNLLDFHNVGALPHGLDLQRLNDGEGIEGTFRKNKAKWHKTCALKFNKTKLDRAKKRKRSSSLPDTSSEYSVQTLSEPNEKKTRSRGFTTLSVKMTNEVCFICNGKANTRKPLYKVASLQDDKIKRCAELTNNVELKAFLEGGDLIAKKAKYHSKCYTNLTNFLRTPSGIKEDGFSSILESMAFASVARFIREKIYASESDNTEVLFKMPHLANIYTNSLSNLLGVESKYLKTIHTTRLRERILDHFPQLKAQLSGRDYFLHRKSANIFQDVHSDNLDDDAVACERFIKKIRKVITEKKVTFDGHLSDDQQAASVPPELLALVCNLLHGYTSSDNTTKVSQPALTISQLIVFNHTESVPKGNIVRHKKSHETPVPLYLGLSVFGRTRNNTIIEAMHERGLSVSSNRIREITADLAHLEILKAQEEGVICPSNLCHGLIVVGAYDNIDHNYSSTTSESSFHGTAISIFQIPIKGEVGEPREVVTRISSVYQRNKKVPDLPDSYSVVKPVTLPSKEPPVPKANQRTSSEMIISEFGSEWKMEQEWLNHILSDDRNEGPLDLSWAAFHASKNGSPSFELSRSSLLPLFNESSSSPSMMKHAMDLIKQITTFLNPDQIPVICVDQPLFALAKSIQWNWPEFYGESKFVTMFGAFHIEQAFLKVLGQILEGSGWTSLVANSGIKTEAGAEACLKVTHVTKARAIHVKTAAVLYSLLHEAFTQGNPDISFEDWIEEKRSNCPTFRFWLLVLDLEVLLLSFIRSIRDGNYELFTQTLKTLTPWFFLMDHPHYARWLPIHIKDLEELKEKAPSLHENFSKGQFVIHKTNNPFSALAVDQAHEQNNALIKGNGGAVGLLQDSAMLRRWMLSGPQLVSILDEFESTRKPNSTDVPVHHEQYPAYQRKFQEQKAHLKRSFLEFGNPFEENSCDLVVWDTKVVMDQERVKAVVGAQDKALQLYNNYVEKRLSNEAKVSLFAPIQKNGTKFFGFARKKVSSPIISDLRSDVELFSRAFIVSQNRQLDLDNFFEHENTSAPPSLSSNGVLRSCQKSQLLKILEEAVDQPQFEGFCDTIIYDGAALAHAIPPKTSRTFEEYCGSEFKNRILNDSERFHVNRIHISWDTYSKACLKKLARNKRGVGLRRQVSQGNLLPKNWNEFLRCDQNKTELFKLLGEHAILNFDRSHIITEIDGIIRSARPDESSIDGVKCKQQEEADSRIFLHAKDSVEHGAKKIIIFTVDTDVVVLAISFFNILKTAGLQEMWILFGAGKGQRYISINAMFESLGDHKAVALRGFHAFTGSDVTSSFAMKGKQTAWTVWKSFPEATAAFYAISIPQQSISDETLQVLERFTVLLYYKDAEDYSVNQIRKFLFTSKNRGLQSLPPTREALRQHCLRSAYLAGQVWGRACSEMDNIPEPEGWGWSMVAGEWTPVWSSLPPIMTACRELVKCSCTECNTRCSCWKAKVPCTLLCKNCTGSRRCNNKYNESYDEVEDE